MLKISFLLKKSNNAQGSLENITIGSPKKTLKGKLTGMYVCETSLSMMEKKNLPICAFNPISTLLNASDFVKLYLQGLVNRGYEISEVESGKP
jgi:hypothetical protein